MIEISIVIFVASLFPQVNMLDGALIFQKGGLVLWSKYYLPSLAPSQQTGSNSKSSLHPIDHLIYEVLLKGRGVGSVDNGEKSPIINFDSYSMQYTLDNKHNLVFVASINGAF